MTSKERLYTADDLWLMSHDHPNKRLELHEGILIEMSPTGVIHGILSMWVGRLLADFTDAHDLGIIVGAETGFILFRNPYTVVGADVAFIAKENISLITEKYYPKAPDIAVEIVSPSDTADEIEEKIDNYMKSGTRLLWVLFAKKRTVHIHRPDHDVVIAKEGDILDGYEVLPGLKLAVSEIYKRLDMK